MCWNHLFINSKKKLFFQHLFGLVFIVGTSLKSLSLIYYIFRHSGSSHKVHMIWLHEITFQSDNASFGIVEPYLKYTYRVFVTGNVVWISNFSRWRLKKTCFRDFSHWKCNSVFLLCFYLGWKNGGKPVLKFLSIL